MYKKNFISKYFVLKKELRVNLLFKNLGVVSFTLLQLLNLGVHYGHLNARWNVNMSLFLKGIRYNLCIINLDYVSYFLRRSLYFTVEMSFNRASFLFTGSDKKGCDNVAKLCALKVNQLFLISAYRGGLLTNFKNLCFSSILKGKSNIGLYKRFPNIVFIFDSETYYFLIFECYLLKVFSIGLIDTDLDFFLCFYPIFGNNDSFKLIIFFFFLFVKAIKVGLCCEKHFLLRKNNNKY